MRSGMKRRLFAVGGEGRARRFAAGLAAAALTIGVVAPLAGLPGEAAQAAPDDVIAAGRVFADFDGDGAFDADPSDGFEEHGVGAVTVTVTDALGRSATTRSVREQGFVDGTGWVWTSDGEWSMTEAQFQDQTGSLPFIKAGDTTAQLRVTFSDIPAGYESWFAGDYAQNATSIQFVLSGDESVDYALLRPEDNRIQPLDVITAIQSAGNPDPLQRNFIDTPAISAVDWMTEQAIHGFVDVDGDGEYTPGVDELAPTDENGDQYRYFSDDNGNGQWDDGEALSQVAFIDENGNGQWDQGPWFNATAYSGVTPADPATQTVSPVTVASVRVLLPNGQECWAGPFTFTERLVNPVTVSDSSVPRPVAYYQEITYGSGCSWAGWDGSPLQVVFVPGGSWEGEPQFTAFPTTEQTTPEDPRTIAMFSEVGSIWGTAYDQTANSALFSAVYKRVSGLAEHQWDGDEQLALGAIYRIPDVNVEGTGKVDPALGESGNVAPWFSLTALGIDLGDAESNSERGLAAGTDVVPDPHGFANAAKIGIGGIDTWTDGTTTYLYAMNLFDQTLYRIDISPAATDPTWVPTAADVLAIPLGLSPTQRPWAVEVWHDEVYVGWTDTGTAPGNCATIEPPTWTPPIDGEPAPGELPECDSYEPMEMVVAKVGLDGGAPVEVLSHPLGYPRGNPIGNWGDAGDAPSQAYPQVRHWNSWTDTWQWDGGSVGLDLEDISNWSTGNNLQVYPQAVLSSLTFTDEGFLSLGFTDRTALQAGNIQQAADVGQPGGSDPDIFFETISAGEMLVAGFDANQGRYILENLGYTRAWGDDGTFQQRWNEAVDHHTTGPGGREFYDDDQALDGAVRGGSVINHEEVALGAVLQPPGAVDVATTAYDPLANIRVQGLMWLTEESGEPHRAVELTDDPGQSETPSSSFQKGGGLGDLDAIIPPPPIEIGNRVWFDADQDGHQSADEPGIGGVRVELVDADGAVIGTQTTLADGT